MKYLKDRQEYIDRYDRATVEKCRWAEKAVTTDFVKKYAKDTDEKEMNKMADAFNNLQVWITVGEMYSKKEETIDKWMKEDEDHDRFFETAKAPDRKSVV